jgi:hypothetical protein
MPLLTKRHWIPIPKLFGIRINFAERKNAFLRYKHTILQDIVIFPFSSFGVKFYVVQ